MSILLALCFWVSCQAFLVEAQRNGRSEFMATHAEVCLPLTSGLIATAPQVMTSSNLTAIASDQRKSKMTQDSFNKALRLSKQGQRARSGGQCFSFVNLLFRTADGSCNNQVTRGQSLQPLARLLPPDYDDGVQSPRKVSVVGSTVPLPSPRVISRIVHPDVISSSDLTILVMQWGQFMDHEMVSTPLPIEDTRGTIQCCGPNRGPPTGSESSECFPILFPPGDPDFDGTCTEFVRSQPVRDSNGNIILPRENENLITSFIDASAVYGNTAERQERLRDTNKRYLLRTTVDNFPPDNGINDCVKRDSNDICFLAGDDRVNEQPALTFIHTVFMRYHNVLAKQLKRRTGWLWDEIVFQQARAVVGAVMQNIMFSEWLPIVLGPSVRAQFGLDFDPACRTHHDQSQDPRIFTAFSTAVFRFGHTLIPRSLPISPSRRVLLRELFFKPFETRENFDTLTQGLVQATDSEDRSQPPDQFFVEEVTGNLFENQEGDRKGFDLVALNIQRARDHGIPSYNAFREELGLGRVTSFLDPALGTAGPDLQSVYDHVDDIDLFSGGMSEPAFDGGLVGETFSKLMGLQLQRVKFGDRFFFDNERHLFGFTDSQVRLLRRVRLAHVLCLTTGLSRVQRDVFRVAGPGNPLVDCATLRAEHPRMSRFRRYPFA